MIESRIPDSGVLGAVDTAKDIARGSLDAVAHVASVLRTAQESQRTVRPWAYIDHNGAMAAAERADEQRAAGQKLGPLHGVAVGVKDVISVAGMPMRAGSEALPDAPAAVDATAVARLRAAGAIIVGKTTTHEFASGQGDPGTRNPRHPDRHPGGSSVGSAVAVAVGSVGATLATDTTGSIRNPSAVHGVVGFKPRNGSIDPEGMIHFSRTLDVVGPIGTSVADCRILYEALTQMRAHLDLARPPVMIVAAPAPPPGTDPGFGAVFERTIAMLERAGAVLVPHAPLGYGDATTVALVLSLVDVLAEHREILRAQGSRLSSRTRQLLASGCLLDQEDADLARRAQIRLTQELADLRARTRADVVIGMTLPGPPPLLAGAETMLTASAAGGGIAAGIQQLSMANVTGAPAITLPVGESGGHPVGVHLMGLDSDRRLLAVAEFVERVVRGGQGKSG